MIRTPANSGMTTDERCRASSVRAGLRTGFNRIKLGCLTVVWALALVGMGSISWTPAAIATPLFHSPLHPPTLVSALPPGNAVTDGKAILRYALPIENQPVRDLQGSLESMAQALRSRRIAALSKNLDTAERILDRKHDALLASVPEASKAVAENLISQLKADIAATRPEIEAKNREAVWAKRNQMLDRVGELEMLMITQYAYQAPPEYANLPQLRGHATIEIKTEKGDMLMELDGYNAPLTAGNFVDLVDRQFYDGLMFDRVEDYYFLQAGKPRGNDEGFIDPQTKQYRAIPLEYKMVGDDKPTYGVTPEDTGRYMDKVVLPFSAYGTVAMARPDTNLNGGSSQFFFFLFEPELTPAGANLLDGRFSVFGYVTQNKELLGQLKQGDKILSMKVVQGLENLVRPTA